MRMHISMDDELVGELDRRAGARGRSSYIADAVRERLDRDRRWELIWSGVGSIPDHGHEWDDDPAEWVRRERFADPRRVG